MALPNENTLLPWLRPSRVIQIMMSLLSTPVQKVLSFRAVELSGGYLGPPNAQRGDHGSFADHTTGTRSRSNREADGGHIVASGHGGIRAFWARYPWHRVNECNSRLASERWTCFYCQKATVEVARSILRLPQQAAAAKGGCCRGGEVEHA